MTLRAVALLALISGPAGAQAPDDPWAMALPSEAATSAALVGSGDAGLACPEPGAGGQASDDGVAAGIMCIIGGARMSDGTPETPDAPATTGPRVPPTAAEIVEDILSGSP